MRKTQNRVNVNYKGVYIKLRNGALKMLLNSLKQKTVCLHFHYKRGIFPEPELINNGEKIKVVKEARFLGVIFDQKLSFIPHLKALEGKYLKALDIIKVVANQEWGGADKFVLLNLYRSLIRSKLDYGCIVYGSARPSYSKMLNTIHHQG